MSESGVEYEREHGPEPGLAPECELEPVCELELELEDETGPVLGAEGDLGFEGLPAPAEVAANISVLDLLALEHWEAAGDHGIALLVEDTIEQDDVPDSG